MCCDIETKKCCKILPAVLCAILIVAAIAVFAGRVFHKQSEYAEYEGW